MNRTAKTVRLLQAVAAIASLAVLLWSLGFPTFRIADAANLTYVSNTLSDSDVAAVSNHEIDYTIPSGSAGVESGESITVTFPDGFNIATSGVAVADVDLEVDGVDETLVAGAPGAAEWQVATSGQSITFTSGGASAVIAANATVTIKIGTNADGGTNQVTNHSSAGSYEFTITSGTGGNNDSGSTRVAILDNVDVTASVDTLFTFTVAGVGGGQAVNGTSTTGTTTATSIPFGALTAGNATTSAQDLAVVTNATQGFTVSVVADNQLLSSTGADIDGFSNGSYVTDPTSWSSPLATVGSENTYGHWGITSDDTDTTARGAEEFAADEWVSASSSAVVVMGNDGPADGTTTGVGTTRVGYQVEISALQEAGDDYQATLTYIATPIF